MDRLGRELTLVGHTRDLDALYRWKWELMGDYIRIAVFLGGIHVEWEDRLVCEVV